MPCLENHWERERARPFAGSLVRWRDVRACGGAEAEGALETSGGEGLVLILRSGCAVSPAQDRARRGLGEDTAAARASPQRVGPLLLWALSSASSRPGLADAPRSESAQEAAQDEHRLFAADDRSGPVRLLSPPGSPPPAASSLRLSPPLPQSHSTCSRARRSDCSAACLKSVRTLCQGFLRMRISVSPRARCERTQRNVRRFSLLAGSIAVSWGYPGDYRATSIYTRRPCTLKHAGLRGHPDELGDICWPRVLGKAGEHKVSMLSKRHSSSPRSRPIEIGGLFLRHLFSVPPAMLNA
ncbi:hypothetical protein OH77DRAFT_719886 [Trametes cingulata]|nr:hypothetical protein OH77DRAFT_719886 [Trametes cingulata]